MELNRVLCIERLRKGWMGAALLGGGVLERGDLDPGENCTRPSRSLSVEDEQGEANSLMEADTA